MAGDLLLRGPDDDAPTPSTFPRRFGDYELQRRLGKGGMGQVYLARDDSLGRLVAIKCLRDGALADESAKRGLRREGELLAEQRHPHIVKVHRLSEHEGEPFLVMDYMARGTLRDRAPHGVRGDPARAAELLATVARAVHAGHEIDVIHRDLKPENILFDEEDEPYVSDFGVAKHVGSQGSLAAGGAGTTDYMSPEQARGQDDDPTVDVWALGVILYELLAGRRPFEGPTMIEVLRSATLDAPAPLAHLTSRLGRDVATVCLTCLEKMPSHRYRSALALAEDLERCLRGEAPLVKRPGRAVRAWRWCLRRPAAAAFFAAAVITLIVLSLWGVGTGLAQAEARRREVLANNVFAARAVAGMVLEQLQEYADVVQAEAKDPRLAEAIATRDDPTVQALAEAIHARHGGPGSALGWWFVIDAGGNARARQSAHAPRMDNPDAWRRDYMFRDYYRGALAQRAGARREVYVSRAFRATSDYQYKVAIVSPVRDRGGAVVGVLAAEFVTDQRFGPLSLSDDRRITVLTVRRDRESGSEPVPDEHILLVHDGVKHGEGVPIENAALRRLTARRVARGISTAGEDQLRLAPADLVESDGDYHDPLAPRDPRGAAGPSLAGIAPVGDTELAVIVQTRLEAATAIDVQSVHVLVAWSACGAALMFAGLFAILRTSRARRWAPRR